MNLAGTVQALDEMLNRAMFHYKNDIKWKTKVDEMQLSYRCCGVKSYKDWFRYSWVEKTNVAKEGEMTGYMQHGTLMHSRCHLIQSEVVLDR